MAYQSMDFPQLFAVAQQLREGRQRQSAFEMEMAQRKDALAREGALRQALSAYYQRGDESALRAQFPQEFAKIQEGKVDLEAKRAALGKTTAEATELERKSREARSLGTARVLRRAANEARLNPMAGGMIGRRLAALAEAGQIDLPEAAKGANLGDISPDVFEDWAKSAESAPGGVQQPSPTDIAKGVAEDFGITIEEAYTSPKARSEMAKRRTQALKSRQTTVNVGLPGVAEEPTAGVKGQLQTKVIENTNLLRQIGEISNIDPRSYLGAVGTIKQIGATAADWVGAASALGADEYLKRRTKIQQTVEAIFNAYRKEITGAGASTQELANLKKSIVNMNLGPTEFGFALERFRDEIMAQTRLYRRALRVGVEIGRRPTGEELTQQINEWRLDGDSGMTAEDIDGRFEELTSQGKSEAAATRILYQEGYINTEQLNSALRSFGSKKR